MSWIQTDQYSWSPLYVGPKIKLKKKKKKERMSKTRKKNAYVSLAANSALSNFVLNPCKTHCVYYYNDFTTTLKCT